MVLASSAVYSPNFILLRVILPVNGRRQIGKKRATTSLISWALEWENNYKDSPQHSNGEEAQKSTKFNE